MFVWTGAVDFFLPAPLRPALFTILLTTLLTTEWLTVSRYSSPSFFLGFCMKPSRVSALRWQVGTSCQADGESDWAGTLPLYLFHHPWHRFLWLAVTWPWSDGSAARCAVLHSGACTTLLPPLSGNLSAWVAKRADYARYYHIAALGEVAKCSRVWYAVRYPCTPGMFVPASGWDKVENPNQGL